MENDFVHPKNLSLHYFSNVENEDVDSIGTESLLGGGTSRGKYNGFILNKIQIHERIL